MENKICVYTICKNESQFVEKWVKSMSEADSIVVLDTGSTDDTVEKLKNLGVTVEQKIINPWRFDVARNESLKLVPDDCNILVCTDLDEVLEPGWAKVLKDNWVDGKYKECWYKYAWSHMPDGSDGRVFWYCKIHAKGFVWQFPVHEQLTYENEEYRKKLEPLESLWIPEGIKLHHYPAPKTSRSNYLPLLETRVIENPNDFCSNIYLGHEYHYSRKEEKCIEQMNVVLSKFKNINDLEKASCYLFIGDAYTNLGDLYNAEQAYRNAIKTDKTYREGYIGLANVLMRDDNPRKNMEEAYNMLKRALRDGVRHYSWLERDESYSYQIYDLLCLAAYYSNHKKDSLLYAFMAKELYQGDDERLNNNVKLVLQNVNDKILGQ